MLRVEPFRPAHLPQLCDLINSHLGALVPGWALSTSCIAASLEGNPSQFVLNPWVAERQTLCAVERDRVVAAAHLLRYGSDPDVGKDYSGAGDIPWLLGIPRFGDAARALLVAVQDQMSVWQVTHEYAWDFGLPVPIQCGVAVVWPHLVATLEEAGYQSLREEAVYGGRLDAIGPAGEAPVPGLDIRRMAGTDGPRFVALAGEREVGHCEWFADLTLGGARPSLRGWGALAEIQVAEEWRGQGVGTWLVRHAVPWLRLAAIDRVVLAVGAEDEAAGAERFYRRLGWEVFARERCGWIRQ